MKRWTMLSTKKLDPSIVEKLKTEGIDITSEDFISVRPIIDNTIIESILKFVSGGITDVAVTSRNAVEAFCGHIDREKSSNRFALRFFSLDGATKKAIEQNAAILGNNIISCASYAIELAQKIIGSKVREVIFLCGNQRRDELPRLLNDHGIIVHEFVVYETSETPVALNTPFDGVMFFSPSGVRSFFTMNKLSPAAVCLSIGDTTADEIRKYTNNKIIAATVPTQEAIAEITITHFKQKVN